MAVLYSEYQQFMSTDKKQGHWKTGNSGIWGLFDLRQMLQDYIAVEIQKGGKKMNVSNMIEIEG